MTPFDRPLKTAEAASGARAMLPTFGEAWYREEALRDATRKQ